MSRNVEDVMTKTVVVVGESEPFKEIVRRMEEYKVSALPVVDAQGCLVGIVSEADLLLKEEYSPPEARERFLFAGRRHRLERSKAAGLVASEVMTKPVVTIGPKASVAAAARLLHERRVKRLPVVDEDGKVLGIVSRADLLKVFLRSDAEIHKEVVDEILGRLLWIEPYTVRVTVQRGVVTLDGMLEQRSLVSLLLEQVHKVDGVVGVESRLSYEVDDLSLPSVHFTPWGIIEPGAFSKKR